MHQATQATLTSRAPLIMEISRNLNHINIIVGGPEKPSAVADLHVGRKISLGATMRFPGAWLDKQRASLKPGSPQQIMFDAALKILKGDEAPKAVHKTDTGREIDLDQPVLDAKTLTIGFDKSMPEVLTFLGMKDGKGKTLLSLGAKLADAISPPPQREKSQRVAPQSDSFASRTSLVVAALTEVFTKSSVGRQQPGSRNHSADISQQTSGIIPPSTPGPVADAQDGLDLNTQAPQAQTRPPAPKQSQSAPPPRSPKDPLGAEQPNRRASSSGERMGANSLPEINVDDFERDANAALEAIGNPAPASVIKPRMSPQKPEAKLDSESQPDSGESRR
jgi:hypothetical protein